MIPLQKQIKKIVEKIILEDNKKKYYVGKIILDTANINPVTYLSFGTWKLWGSGRVPVGVDVDDIDFNEAEKTGGEKTHTLTLDEMPKHNHTLNDGTDGPGLYPNWGSITGWGVTSEYLNGNGGESNSAYTGSSTVHNNMPPYITCYMWKRVE